MQSSLVITARDLYGNTLQTCQKRHVVSITPVSATSDPTPTPTPTPTSTPVTLAGNLSNMTNSTGGWQGGVGGVSESQSAGGYVEAVQFAADKTCAGKYLLTLSGAYR